MGVRFTAFWQAGHNNNNNNCLKSNIQCIEIRVQDGWLLIKAGDLETNPGLTTTHKQVWICNICHKQIHSRKQISIRCNRIKHWVHQRCAGIHQAQYTDSWTCHLHRESRLTIHTGIIPPPLLQTLVKPLPTPHLHHHTTATTQIQALPLFPKS